MRRMRWLLIGLGGAGICAAGTSGGLALADSGPTQLQPAYVVQDASGGETLSVQLQFGVRDTGAFDFSVSGVGEWLGVIALSDSGPIVNLHGSTAAHFEATGSSSAVPGATVRMEGEIDQSHSTANIDIWVTEPRAADQTKYHLQTARADTSEAQPLAQTALAALVAKDWSAIYGISAREVRQRYTESQFVATLSAEQLPAVSGAAFSGPGSTKVLDGVTYFVEPFTFTAGSGGQSSTYTAVLTLAWEQGQWRFAGTSTPQRSS